MMVRRTATRLALRAFGSGRGYPTQRLTAGGLVNPMSGAGMRGLDKAESFFFEPTRFYSPGPMEILCVQSWAARRVRDLPVDDMFIRWRKWDCDPDRAEVMDECERKHRVQAKLSAVMRAARQHGTGMIVMHTGEAPMDQPLDMRRLREGDLSNLLVVDRWELSTSDWVSDTRDPNYGRGEWYDVYPFRGDAFRCHHSRMLRFDGLTAPTDSGFRWYDQEWGVPDLVPVVLALVQDQAFVSAVAHLAQEASIGKLKVPNLGKAMAGGMHPDDPNVPSVEHIAARINQGKSIYRLMMMDASQEFEREHVTFLGLAQIFDQFPKRVANAADIPLTRWQGMSPAGLSATGESDMRNYVIHMEALRQKQLAGPLAVLDEVLARDAGLAEAPEFEWLSLLELSDMDRAELALKRVESVEKVLASGLVDEDEGRELLKDDEMFAELAGGAPDGWDELMAEPAVQLPPLQMIPGGGANGEGAPAGQNGRGR